MASPNGVRVLIIDRHPDGATALRLLVESWGFATRVADDAMAGIQVANAWSPDVVFCNVGPLEPTADWGAVVRSLRQHPVRLVALTVDPEDREWALSSGFEAVLANPAPPVSLLGLLHTLSL